MPSYETLLELYASVKMVKRVLRTPDEDTKKRVIEWKEQTIGLIKDLITMEIPVSSIEFGPLRTRIEFGMRGMGITNSASYASWYHLVAFFNSNSYPFTGAIDRMLKLIATVKTNIKNVSDNSIRKWLKGEVKIKENDWLKMIAIQSLQNSLK